MVEHELLTLHEVRDLIDVGQVLPFRVVDDSGRLLLNEGQLVSSHHLLELLIERGARVERQQAAQVRRARQAHAASAVVHAERQLTLFDLWEKLLWELDDATRRLARANAAGSEIEALAARVLTLVECDADVALYLSLRQDDRRFALYAHAHGVHTAVVAALAARMLAWPADRLTALTCAALTMNVSISELQAALAEQHEPPSQRQQEQIRAHPQASAALLRQAGVTDAAWLDSVENHHEREDGSGYPRGLTTIGEAATLLRIADVYMAKVSPRAARPAMAPQRAARELFQQQGDSPLAMALIRALGAHPPGALVRLHSGEIAVVTRRPAHGTAPLAAAISNAKGEPIVATHPRDTATAEFAITAPAEAGEGFPRILPDRVYGMILA